MPSEESPSIDTLDDMLKRAGAEILSIADERNLISQLEDAIARSRARMAFLRTGNAGLQTLDPVKPATGPARVPSVKAVS